MQAIMETLFDAAYLVTVVTLGCIMVKSAQDRETKLFGWMAVILGCGDAFHLVPRAWALCTDGLAAHAAALGAGKFITSITMTIFYVILYHIGKRRYGLHIRALTGAVYALAAARIGLCLFPQNAWLSANPPLSWGIWRNVPFALLGALVIVVFLRGARQAGDRAFRWMWLAIVLSFAFYIPVVLGLVHTHLFLLGTVFFLLAALFSKELDWARERNFRLFYGLYNTGLCVTAVMLAVRGAAQVLALPLSRGMDTAISGVAGLGHICLGAGLVVFFLSLKKTACTANVQ